MGVSLAVLAGPLVATATRPRRPRPLPAANRCWAPPPAAPARPPAGARASPRRRTRRARRQRAAGPRSAAPAAAARAAPTRCVAPEMPLVSSAHVSAQHRHSPVRGLGGHAGWPDRGSRRRTCWPARRRHRAARRSARCSPVFITARRSLMVSASS